MRTRKTLVMCVPLLLLLGTTLVACTPTARRTFYVSPTGSDSAAGTSTTNPWRTIAKVNSVDLNAGDRVRFQGGATFPGLLYLEPGDGGTSSSPVVIDSYDGRATLDGGAGNAVYAWRAAGISLTNLRLVGSGAGTNAGDGLAFYNDLPGDVLLPYVRITDVESSGFGKWGIVVGGGLGRSGYSDVRIDRTSTHDNGMGGVLSFAAAAAVHRGVSISNSTAYRNLGRSDATRNSGNGLVLGSVNGGVIERSTAQGNGGANNPSIGQGPVGIWAYDANDVRIQLNESYGNRTGATVDGGGFDLDQNVTNSIVQYNYSHDNDGPGYMLAHGSAAASHSDNVIRYNISQNDRRKNSGGAIEVWGGVRRADVYHNTVYVGAPTGGAIAAVKLVDAPLAVGPSALHFRNNILYATATIPLLGTANSQLGATADIRFEGNDWYQEGADGTFLWGGVRYGSLAAWRTATGQETVGSTAVGTAVNPGMVSPGGGVAGARLSSGSPVVDAGLDLSAFGISSGGRDVFGGGAPLGPRPDIGAHELR